MALEYGKILTTCGTLPRQYPAKPSVLPMATKAANNPLSAAATLAALALDAPAVCIIIFNRSNGAVHVFASAPAHPPAKNMASPGAIKCVSAAVGFSRSTTSLFSVILASFPAAFAALEISAIAFAVPLRPLFAVSVFDIVTDITAGCPAVLRIPPPRPPLIVNPDPNFVGPFAVSTEDVAVIDRRRPSIFVLPALARSPSSVAHSRRVPRHSLAFVCPFRVGSPFLSVYRMCIQCIHI
jgi:hypothetical protein